MKAKIHDDTYCSCFIALFGMLLCILFPYTFCTVGATSGSSIDWTRDNVLVKYNYGPQLRGDSVVVPEDEIVPSGEECYAGMLELLRVVYEDITA